MLPLGWVPSGMRRPGAVTDGVGADLVEVAVDGVEERLGVIEGEEGRLRRVSLTSTGCHRRAVDAEHCYALAVSASLSSV